MVKYQVKNTYMTFVLSFLLVLVFGCDQKQEYSKFIKKPAGQGASNSSGDDGTVDNPEHENDVFTTGTGFDSGTIYKILRDDNLSGDIYIGGSFTRYKGLSSNRIVRLNSDGSIDNAFNYGSGFNADVRDVCLARDGSGDIYVGGTFSTYKGESASKIVRLNSDGSIDSSFSYGSGLNDYVNKVMCLSSGGVLAVGNFTSYQGQQANRIVAIDANGAMDTGFDFGSGFNSGARFYALEEDNNGNIYIGGSFHTYDSASVQNYLRLSADGAIDTAYSKSSGFNSYVLTIKIVSGGAIYGGMFSSFNNEAAPMISKLNYDGDLESSFDVGSGFSGGGSLFFHISTRSS